MYALPPRGAGWCKSLRNERTLTQYFLDDTHHHESLTQIVAETTQRHLFHTARGALLSLLSLPLPSFANTTHRTLLCSGRARGCGVAGDAKE